MLITIHPDNPEPRKIKQVVECLQDGGVIIYPTDTIYGLGADFMQSKAIERICLIKHIKPDKANLSFVCNDLSHLSKYTRPISNDVFKMLKRNLPGPFTFILEANGEVPRLLHWNRKTVGIRVPQNNIALAIALELGHPIVSTSLKHPDDDFIEYLTDAWEVHEAYGNRVDLVIDGGPVGNIPSTIVDCTGGSPVIIRQGAGELL